MTTTNYIKTALLLGLMTGLALASGYLIGGQTGMVVALVLSAALNFGSYWFSDKIVLGMYRAKPVSEPENNPVRQAVVETMPWKPSW